MNTDLTSQATSQSTLETYSSSLTTGGKDEFLPKLKAAINSAVKIDMTVAFVRDTGMKLLMPALKEALERGAQVRILTCDYMQITDPAALRSLLLLKEPFNDQGSCAEVRVFESKGISFHMKAYIFITTVPLRINKKA